MSRASQEALLSLCFLVMIPIQTPFRLKHDGVSTVSLPRQMGHSWDWGHLGSLSELLVSWNLSCSELLEGFVRHGMVIVACCSSCVGGQEAIFAVDSEEVPLRIVQRSICGPGGHL